MEPEQPEIPPVIHQAQVTPAHVIEALGVLKSEVNARFDTIEGKVDRLEGTVKESGLNGYSPYLKSFLEQYSATYVQRQAWLTVRADIGHRLHWLSSPKSWLKALFYAAIGGLGWKLVSGLNLPHLPF